MAIPMFVNKSPFLSYLLFLALFLYAPAIKNAEAIMPTNV